MGYGMASNLIKAKHDVISFDLDNAKLDALVQIGAEKINEIKELPNLVEIVMLCLPHPDISKDVIFNHLLALKGKLKIIIDTSTLTPEDTQEIHDNLAKQNIKFLCSPMLGGKNAAQNKKIHFLVEGDKDTFIKCESLS